MCCVYCRHIADPEIIEEGSPVRRRRHVESDEEEKSSEDEEEIDEEVCTSSTFVKYTYFPHTYVYDVRTLHTYVRMFGCELTLCVLVVLGDGAKESGDKGEGPSAGQAAGRGGDDDQGGGADGGARGRILGV